MEFHREKNRRKSLSPKALYISVPPLCSLCYFLNLSPETKRVAIIVWQKRSSIAIALS